MKDAAGAASTITPRSALPRTGSWSPRGAVFPPQSAPANWSYPRPHSRTASARAVAPPSCGPHDPRSIATLRRLRATFLIRQLPRYLFCGALRL